MRDFRTVAGIIKQSVSALTVGTDLGLAPNKDGRCRCVFHNDRNPAMKLYKGDRGYHCFACHATGDIIDLTQQVRGGSKLDAIRWLNDWYGLMLPLDHPDRKAMDAARAEARRRQEERRRAQDAQEAAQKALYEATTILDGLEAIIREKAPRRPENGIPGDVDIDWEFAAALKLRDEWRERLEEAKDRIYELNLARLNREKGGDEYGSQGSRIAGECDHDRVLQQGRLQHRRPV